MKHFDKFVLNPETKLFERTYIEEPDVDNPYICDECHLETENIYFYTAGPHDFIAVCDECKKVFDNGKN